MSTNIYTPKHTIASTKRYSMRFIIIECLFILTACSCLFYLSWELLGSDIAARSSKAALVKEIEQSFTVKPASVDSNQAKTGTVEVKTEQAHYAPFHSGAPSTQPRYPAYRERQGVGLIRVPRWGSNHKLPIIEGTTDRVLDTGSAGHYVSTPLPGLPGNVALAAHRQSYDGSFHRIHKLVDGDKIIIETAEYAFVYKFKKIVHVTENDSIVISFDPPQFHMEPGGYYLTLTTCEFWDNTRRAVAYSELIGYYDKREGIVPDNNDI